MANVNLFDDSGLIVAHYLRSVTANVALGAEFALQYGAQCPGRQIALFSVAGRYNGKNWPFSPRFFCDFFFSRGFRYQYSCIGYAWHARCTSLLLPESVGATPNRVRVGDESADGGIDG